MSKLPFGMLAIRSWPNAILAMQADINNPKKL